MRALSVLAVLWALPVERALADHVACTLSVNLAWSGQPNLTDPRGDWTISGGLVHRGGTDIEHVWLSRGLPGTLRAGVSVQSLPETQPLSLLRILWDYQGSEPGPTTWWVSASMGLDGNTFRYGRWRPDTGYVILGETTGTVWPGSPGFVIVDAPVADMGAPPSGTVLAHFRASSAFEAGEAHLVADDTDGTATRPANGCDPLLEEPPPGPGPGPITKRCVGDPPRQTEDPMSPPCIPFFDGDNFGDIGPGVTADEIRVLIYLDRGCPNFECAPSSGRYIDLDSPPQPPCPKTWPADNPDHDQCDYIMIRAARAFAAHFNGRWQTYKRRVHYYAYITSAGSAAARRADAADNWARLRPFADIDQAVYNGHNESYLDSMAARGTMVFSTPFVQSEEFFTRNNPYAWSLWPDTARMADVYAGYVCARVAPFPVAHAGNPQGTSPSVGMPRRFGLFYTTDSAHGGLPAFANLVKQRLVTCGIVDPAEATFPRSGFVVDGSEPGDYAALAVATFQAAGVTTVLWLGGIEGKFTHAADAAAYYPEIVIAGDLDLDSNATSRFQNQSVWQNAWGVQHQPRIDAGTSAGHIAYREGDPSAPEEDVRYGANFYRDHFLLFYAAQAAGPQLDPRHVEWGLRAIPEYTSTSPYAATCYFGPSGNTCVKDAAEVWWDPTGMASGFTQPGCMRMVDGGRRYKAGGWPSADRVFDDRSDPCTAHERPARISP